MDGAGWELQFGTVFQGDCYGLVTGLEPGTGLEAVIGVIYTVAYEVTDLSAQINCFGSAVIPAGSPGREQIHG